VVEISFSIVCLGVKGTKRGLQTYKSVCNIIYMKINNNGSTQRIFEHYCCSKNIIKISWLCLFLFLLVPSSGSIFYLSSTQVAQQQQQQQNTTPAGIAAATTSV